MAPSASGNRVTADEPRSIETSHEDMIHDAQLDFYGKRLATCSSDRTIKVFDVVDGVAGNQRATLRGHEGPVWQVAWAHPKFGPILASCSYDGKVAIWKDNGSAGGASSGYGSQGYGQSAEAGGWTQIKEHKVHDGSVNSISWAPYELGASLACASSDGSVSVATFKDDGSWAVHKVVAHPSGCNAVSWAPATLPGALISAQQPSQQRPGEAAADQNAQQYVRRFATAGGDSLVKIWEYQAEAGLYVQIETLNGHTDWVRDVAFAPNIGLPRTYLASASQDRTVLIWTQDGPSSPWISTPLNPSSASTAGVDASGAAASGGKDSGAKFPDTVWRLSWSVSGNVLAVSCGDGKVTLWKENLKGKWECVSEMDS
ncbi:unnamed protein product [Tilletia controversa]|uniref:Protein transport protein SEC13 n=3 Tax=Tilletia TaxID=13289 RepID=A0A8X7MZY6_9BASI|nr:hypothetical protein CF336_g588 [Tilletia laevis]KAE8204741.1 hypothetical protein CF328_g900 [Tilletia controversa]KAE8265830.1 hypothetical protein A4X03_0g14 [Tilletia caries]KAE8208610.1 hypothetical protein CF335_g284 [Tilletia laevis]KAE8254892.1 hypothetical protein A4X06_0g687 [Tilletia controversa]